MWLRYIINKLQPDLKNISCIAYLSSRGIEPKSTRGRTYKYFSPWRGKSFHLHVYPESNTWRDYGDSVSGDVIDLCMKVEGVGFSEACKILLGNDQYKVQTAKMPERQQESPIKILWMGDIESKWLIRYIEGRGIPIDVARRFCKQGRIEITAGDEKYRKTVVLWKSDKGGYEMRSSETKISNSPKYLTTINQHKKELHLLEGFFDFLSLVVLFGYTYDATYVILNSIGHAAYVNFSEYHTVNYWCDNDARVISWWDGLKHPNKIDKRILFKGFNDLNDYLTHGNKTHRQSSRKDGRILRLLGWGKNMDGLSM